jgi:hypothetical protein
MDPRSEAEAWLAGIQHARDCPGCAICLLVEPPLPKPPNDEQTLNESVEKE